jgi:peroxin-16
MVGLDSLAYYGVLIALIAILLANSPRKSTRPLTAIAVMELLSRRLRRTPSPSSSLERAEYARRDRDVAWYLLRGPIWDEFTRSVPLPMMWI